MASPPFLVRLTHIWMESPGCFLLARRGSYFCSALWPDKGHESGLLIHFSIPGLCKNHWFSTLY